MRDVSSDNIQVFLLIQQSVQFCLVVLDVAVNRLLVPCIDEFFIDEEEFEDEEEEFGDEYGE